MNAQDSTQRVSSYSFADFNLDTATERLARGSDEIKLRPKSFQVLRYLVEHHGRLVTREELMQTFWGDVAVTDESITKCIADIRKALADDAQEIVRTVTRRGFLFLADVRVIETAQPKIEPAPPANPAAPAGHAVMIAGLSALVLVAAAAAAYQLHHLSSARTPAFEAIAVLPFVCLSNSADQQYLGDGLTEALITHLGESSPLRVIGRTSVNQYLRTNKSIREIARELDVDLLVEGTVTQSGDRLRVTANLIQVSPEKHLWARSYERSFRDVLSLQNEIAASITGEIQVKLTPKQRTRLGSRRAVDPEAQLAYWKALSLLDHSRGNPDVHRKAIEYSEHAVRLDPGYAPAFAVLSRSYGGLSDIGEAFPREVMPRAKAIAEQAIALDEDLGAGHVALGYVLLIYERDWTGAERESRRALELNQSDAEGRWLLANYLAAVGRVDEAAVEMKRARDLDPLSFQLNWNVGRMLCLARKYDAALADLRRTGDMQQSPGVDIWVFKSNWMKGLVNDALAVDLRIREYRDHLSAESLEALRTAFRRKGSPGYWAKLRELLLPKFETNPIGWYRLAEINTYLGDKEEAFRWLEKAFDERPNWIPFLKVDPTLDPLRSDPRFGAMVRRMGLTP